MYFLIKENKRIKKKDALQRAKERGTKSGETSFLLCTKKIHYISHRTLLRKRTILIQFLIFNVFSCRSVFEWKIKCRYNCVNFDKSRSKYILFFFCRSMSFCFFFALL